MNFTDLTRDQQRAICSLLLSLHRCQPQPGLPPADKPAPKPVAKNKPTWAQIKAWREKGIHWFSHWHAARKHVRAMYAPSTSEYKAARYFDFRSYLCVPPDELQMAGVFIFIGHQPHDVSTISEIYIPTPATGRSGDLGFRVERPEGALVQVSHWQVTLRDPATGDTFQRSCRAISADNAVRKVMATDVCPNAHLVDIEEISSWEAEMLPYEEYDSDAEEYADAITDKELAKYYFERRNGTGAFAPDPELNGDYLLEIHGSQEAIDAAEAEERAFMETEQFEVRPVVVGQLGVVHA